MKDMDWTTIIVTTMTTIGSVLLAWLTLRGKLAELGKTATAAKDKAERAAGAAVAAAKSSHKTEQSINNRDSPASDRWDAIHDDVKKIAAAQREQGRDIQGLQETAHQTRKSIGRLTGEDRQAHREIEQLRTDFSEHLESAAERDRQIRELHQRYVEEAPSEENPT